MLVAKYPTFHFVCFIFCISLTSSFISPDAIELGLKFPYVSNVPFPYKTSSPIDVQFARPVLVPTPLIPTNGVFERVKVKNNGDTISVLQDQPKTRCKISGGVLFNNTYIFDKIRFHWTDDATYMKVVVFYYKEEYGSFENSFSYRDGIVDVSYFVNIVPNKPNAAFPLFAKSLKQVKKAGTSVDTFSFMTFLWFDLGPDATFYYAYPGSYLDEKSGKRFDCSIDIHIPAQFHATISDKQFNAFQELRNSSGLPLTDQIKKFPQGIRPVVSAAGIDQNFKLF